MLERVVSGMKRTGSVQKNASDKEAKAKDKEQCEKVKLAAAEKLQDKASNVQIGFGCHICGEEFSSHKELDDHLNDHQKKTTYFTCHSCSQKFTDYNAYLHTSRVS